MLNVQNLEAVLKLVAQTKDRVIILSENEDPLVIMNLESYRDLLAKNTVKKDPSQQVALDNINKDIALLHASETDVPDLADYNLEQFKVEEDNSDNGNKLVDTEEEEKYYLEPVD
jgi:PHD/YefM family antitoxin component YafN of YafNO toxin-antitoxin module